MSGRRSLISEIARSSRFTSKYGPPQWRSERCAIRNGRSLDGIVASLERWFRARQLAGDLGKRRCDREAGAFRGLPRRRRGSSRRTRLLPNPVGEQEMAVRRASYPRPGARLAHGKHRVSGVPRITTTSIRQRRRARVRLHPRLVRDSVGLRAAHVRPRAGRGGAGDARVHSRLLPTRSRISTSRSR